MLLADFDLIDSGFSGALVLLLSTLFLASIWKPWRGSGLPLVNGKERFEVLSTNAKKRFAGHARGLIQEGFAKSTKAFFLMTDCGKEMILSPQYIEEIRSDRRLDFLAYQADKFHPDIPGFEMLSPKEVGEKSLTDLIYKKLTPAIGKCTEFISSEARDGLQGLWTDNPDWHEIKLKDSLLELSALESTRIFLGEDLCRNPAWYRLINHNVVNCFVAADQLRMWPWILRPLVHWFIPSCNALRADMKEARQIINSEVEQRRASKAVLVAQGKTPKKFFDAIEWMEEVANGRVYDPALVQLGLSVGSMHTTPDLLAQVMLNLSGHPDLVDDLRNEIISVKGEEPWGKPVLFKLKLMDSVIKETQRLKPILLALMGRKACEAVKFSDGLEIPKGTHLLVSSHNMQDSSIYLNADQFDGYRFYRLRKAPGNEHSAQLVSTNANHTGFGYGHQACPGRFLAAAMIKVALCHILLKYDFQLADGSDSRFYEQGMSLVSSPTAKLAIRRRQEEVAL